MMVCKNLKELRSKWRIIYSNFLLQGFFFFVWSYWRSCCERQQCDPIEKFVAPDRLLTYGRHRESLRKKIFSRVSLISLALNFYLVFLLPSLIFFLISFVA